MTRRKQILAFLVVLLPMVVILLLISIFGQPGSRDDLGYRRMADFLLANNMLNGDFDGILGDVMTRTLAEQDSQHKFQINSPYQSEGINIYVIRGGITETIRKSERWGYIDSKDFLSLVRNNFLSLPPNVIIVDSEFLSELLLNAFNEASSFGQAMDLSSSLENLSSSLEKMSAFGRIADHLRLQNLRNRDQSHEIAAFIPEGWERALSGASIEIFDWTLAPILLHELAHLSVYPGIAGFQNPEGYFQEYLSRYVLAEEDRADKVALESIEAMLAKVKDSKREKDFQTLLKIQTFVSLGYFLRDSVLLKAFDGFRGLKAEDLLIALFHGSCKDKPKNVSHGIIDLEWVQMGLRSRLPLLTAQEYKTIRERFQQQGAVQTHAHHFVRAARVQEIASEVYDIDLTDETIDRYLPLLRSASTGNPEELYFEPRSRGTGISREQLLKSLEESLEIWPAVTCPAGFCEIGYIRDDLGHLEIIGPMDNIRHVRLVMQARSEDMATRARQIAFLARFMANVLSTLEMDQVFALIALVRDQVLTCGAYSARWEEPNFDISIRTINEDGWIMVEINSMDF